MSREVRWMAGQPILPTGADREERGDGRLQDEPNDIGPPTRFKRFPRKPRYQFFHGRGPSFPRPNDPRRTVGRLWQVGRL